MSTDTYEFAPLHGSSSEASLGMSVADLEHLHEQARAAGEAEGREAGLLAAHAEIDSALSALARAAQDLDGLREELANKLERDAVELALQLSERILGGALDAQPERVHDVVRGALRRLSDRHRVTVLVSPDDLELVAGRMDELRGELGGIEHCDVQADRRVGRGGAVVGTPEGEIDAQIDVQLQHAREIVAEHLRGPGAS